MGKRKGQGYTIFYVAIAICFIVSGVAVYGLMSNINTYRESEEAYADIQAQAIYTAPPTGLAAEAHETPVSADTQADISPASPAVTPAAEENGEDSLEGETVEDEALFWMLEHQNSTWETISPMTSKNVLIASASNTLSAAGRTDITEARPESTVAPAAAEVADIAATDMHPTSAPTVEPAAEPTPETTLEPALSPTPEPTPAYTKVPFYIPKDGISMERAVTYDSARYFVDFDYLSRINDEVVGWLMQDNTDINYPIMRGEDNEFYLTHMMDRTKNKNGSLFMDCGNSVAFIDEATYVYGHNSKNGGMFALLSNYVEQSYYDEHPQFLLMSPFADYQVDVFAGIKTTVEDETSWRIKLFEDATGFDSYVKDICSQSMFKADSGSRPVWGDKMLVLVTCTNIEHGDRYVIYGRMRPIVYESTESVEATKHEMDNRATISGYKQVGTLGKMMVYAQNDPVWDKMRYETRKVNKHRVLGDGGCGPTSAAMIIANLVPKEKLPLLIGFADYDLGYTFCDCSVNRYYCNHLHAQYHLKTPDEFLRYLPVAVANYATGNNMWGIMSRGGNAGTSMRFLETMCLIYRLRLSATRNLEEAVERLRNGDCLILVSVSRGPYTTRGHYLVLAGVDDQYLYVLDPYSRENYGTNYRAELVEVLEPGVTRVKLEDAEKCFFHTMYTVERTPET